MGLYAIVDAEDFDRVSELRWHATRGGRDNKYYARAYTPTGRVYLHRYILGVFGRGVDVDHVNRNGLDCSRKNLRACTRSQNNKNRHRISDVTSRYRGVCFNSVCRKWQAQIASGGRNRYLGIFTDEREAATAWDRAATVLHGEFACLNFPV